MNEYSVQTFERSRKEVGVGQGGPGFIERGPKRHHFDDHGQHFNAYGPISAPERNASGQHHHEGAGEGADGNVGNPPRGRRD